MVAAAAVLVIVGLAPAAVAGTSVSGSVVFRLQDPRLDEASGLALGLASPGVVYVQNDSGDTNRVFALDARTGATAAVVTVAGAVNHDWEDIAVAPDAAGTPSLWIADTGDNRAVRDEVQVYRVDEPRVSAAARDRAVTTGPADVWRVRYPAGPADVESLAVTPHGVPYLVTKAVTGRSIVYRLPTTPDAGQVRTAVRVGHVRFTGTNTANPFGLAGQLTATGAAFSRDGRLLVVRTYADAWLWRVGGAGVAAALRTEPRHVPLPEQPQGEGVAVDGDRLLLDSEGVHTAVLSVALPRAPATSPTTAPATAMAPAGPSTPAPSRPRAHHTSPLPSRRATAVAVIVAILLAGGAIVFTRRRR